MKHLRKAEKQAEDLDLSENDEEEEEEEDGRDEEGTEANNSEGNLDGGDVEMEDVTEGDARPKDQTRQKESSLPVYNDSALGQYDCEEVKEDILTLEKERDTMAKNANMAAIAEYRRKEQDYLKR